MKKIPVGELEELARRKLNRLLSDIEARENALEEMEAAALSMSGQLGTLQADITGLQNGVAAVQASLAGKQNTIVPADGIANINASFSVALSLAFLTTLMAGLGNTNAKVNAILGALRQKGLIAATPV